MQSQWQALRPFLAANAPQVQENAHEDQREQAKRLGNVPPTERGLLHSAFVTWLLTKGSAEDLKNNMISLRQLYNEKSENITPNRMLQQIKLSRNHEERNGDALKLASAAWALFSNSNGRRSFKAQTKRHPVCSDARLRKRQCVEQEVIQSDMVPRKIKEEPLDATDSDGDGGVIQSQWLKND